MKKKALTRMIERIKGMKPEKGIGGLILILFFFSGFCGMIYVIAWMQVLRFFLGPPLLSIISVLTIFLGGIALGSFFAGCFIDTRPDPLKIYGLLEGALGIYSLILPWLIHRAAPLYKVIYQNARSPFYISFLLRYFLSASMLLIPSILIGAIWPVISKLLINKKENLGWTMGKIYGVNTLGGFFGILITGFLFLPYLGVNNSIYLGAGIDLMICTSSLLLYKNAKSWQTVSEGPAIGKVYREDIPKNESIYGKMRWIILIGYGLAALAAMMFQVIWLRVLIIFLDSSLPALFLVLSTFILGLALGSLCLARFVDKRKNPLLLLGFMEIIIGISSLVIIPLLERYPIFMSPIIAKFANSFWLLQFMGFLLFFLIIMIPTILLGLSFPLVSRIYSDKIKGIGKSISAVFSINAFGYMFGALLGGILLITWPGIKRGSLAPVWFHIFAGCLFLLLCYSISRTIKITIFILFAGFFITFSYFLPVWELPFFKGDPYRHTYHQGSYLPEKTFTHITAFKKKKETIFSKEGIISYVTVTKDKKDISMHVNGKLECSTTRDLSSQILSGHIPLLLHNDPKDILIMGLGGGITLGSIEQYPVREIDCVEISQGVIEGSGHFHEFNNNALKDSRLKLIIEDVGHHLMFTDRKYDVIISKTLNTWPGSMSDFFTEEFFKLCQQRLKSGGIAAIHLSDQEIKKESLKSILFKWYKIFPFINLWETELGKDYLLIGSNQELKWDYPLVIDKLDKAKIASDLSRIQIKEPHLSLLTFYFMDNQGLPPICQFGRTFLDRGLQKLFFEPKLINDETIDYPLEDLQHNRGKGLHNLLANLQELDDSEIRIIKEKIDKAMKARKSLTKAYIDLIRNESRDKVLDRLKEALQINPNDNKVLELYNDILFATATDYFDQKEYNLTLWTLLEIIRIKSDNLKAHFLLGKTYYNLGMIDQAVTEYEKVIESRPDDEEVHCHLGIAYLNNGWIDLSISRFNNAIRINPDYPEPHLYLGVAYFKKEMIDHAIEEYRNAIVLGPSNADAHYNLGIAYLQIGMIDEAVSEWQEVISIRPNDVNSRYNLAMAYYNHGDIDQSITQLEKALKVKPDFSQARSLLQMLYQMRQE